MQGVVDRGFEFVGQSKDFIVSVFDICVGKDGDFFDVVKQFDQLMDVFWVWFDSWLMIWDENWGGCCSFFVGNVVGKGDNGDGVISNGMVDG